MLHDHASSTSGRMIIRLLRGLIDRLLLKQLPTIVIALLVTQGLYDGGELSESHWPTCQLADVWIMPRKLSQWYSASALLPTYDQDRSPVHAGSHCKACASSLENHGKSLLMAGEADRDDINQLSDVE